MRDKEVALQPKTAIPEAIVSRSGALRSSWFDSEKDAENQSRLLATKRIEAQSELTEFEWGES
jgi:hypothetical protein